VQGTHEEGKGEEDMEKRETTHRDERKRVDASECTRERRKSPGGIMAWHGDAL
jgi:hypothetical protein